jgi:hypothetical protein
MLWSLIRTTEGRLSSLYRIILSNWLLGAHNDCLKEGRKLYPQPQQNVQDLGLRFHEPKVSFVIESAVSLLDNLGIHESMLAFILWL